MKAVIYVRYSSDGQREESIEGQLRECKEFAERHNMAVVSSYIDRALSARTDDRPEFQKMVRDSAKKQFDVVLVWKLDRFSRNRFDSATYRAILKRNGVKVVSAKLYCGNDGAMMVGTSGKSKTGKVHHYYKCGNALHKKSCNKKAVRKAWIEHYVASLARDVVLVDENISRLAEAIVELQKQEDTTIPFLNKQLADVDKRISNLIDSIEEGFSNASVKTRLDELEAKKADIEIALARASIEKTLLTTEQIVFWISKFKGGDIDSPEYRKILVDVFINSVFLYDDRIVITFNYKDGTKTVTLAELETAEAAADKNNNSGKLLYINDNRGSYLEKSAPPICNQALRALGCVNIIIRVMQISNVFLGVFINCNVTHRCE